jgi:hypothetical protein
MCRKLQLHHGVSLPDLLLDIRLGGTGFHCGFHQERFCVGHSEHSHLLDNLPRTLLALDMGAARRLPQYHDALPAGIRRTLVQPVYVDLPIRQEVHRLPESVPGVPKEPYITHKRALHHP